jgi:hypothetical protein
VTADKRARLCRLGPLVSPARAQSTTSPKHGEVRLRMTACRFDK